MGDLRTAVSAPGHRYAFDTPDGRSCCRSDRLLFLCTACAAAAGAHKTARSAAMRMTAPRQEELIDGIVFRNQQHFGGAQAGPSIEMAVAGLRDFVGEGPYDQALRRSGRAKAPATLIRDARGVPLTYDSAFARRQAGDR